MLVSIQTDHVVTAGERVFGLGGGKFKAQDEAEVEDTCVMWPAFKDDEVMISHDGKLSSIFTVLSSLLALGMLKLPLLIPFHSVEEVETALHACFGKRDGHQANESSL